MTDLDVLVLNCGSSSVKFALVDAKTGHRRVTGLAERIGTPEAVLHVSIDGSKVTSKPKDPSHRGVITTLLAELDGFKPVAVGHRVVHGGERFTQSVLIDEGNLKAIEDYIQLAPLHNRPNADGIRAAKEVLPGLSHVAVFDTAFHQSLPPKAFRYAVPTWWYDEHAVRRYGFHGTSHQYVSQKANAILDNKNARLVIAHLGNGCSATAVKAGVSIDTTMGLTPLEGLMMGTRSGDVDPGLHEYIAKRTGDDIHAITDALNKQSGLLGVSQSSNDMRTLMQEATNGNNAAELAIEIFVYRLAKYIASYLVPLGGLDALVFTGGIGENSAEIRRRVIDELSFLSIEVDTAANESNGVNTNGRISMTTTPAILVIPTDEELLIAQDTISVCGLK